MNELERNKALARRLMGEDISQGDEAVAAAIIHPDFCDHTNPPGMQHGLEGHTAVVRLFRDVFPDLEWRIDDLIAEGDKVVARTTMRGTQLGDVLRHPAHRHAGRDDRRPHHAGRRRQDHRALGQQRRSRSHAPTRSGPDAGGGSAGVGPPGEPEHARRARRGTMCVRYLPAGKPLHTTTRSDAVQRSPGVAAAVRGFYERFSANDVDGCAAVLSPQADSIVIGTEPAEWYDGRDAWIDAYGEQITAVPGIRIALVSPTRS